MSRTPMGRLGLSSEIADTVAQFASDAASYITGETTVVDGSRMTLNHTVTVTACRRLLLGNNKRVNWLTGQAANGFFR